MIITTSRFLGYDKNEYGDLIVNRKEAEIVSLTFDLYLLNVGSSRIGELLDYLTAEKHSGADRFTTKKSNGFAAPTLKRESRHVKG